MTVLFCRGFLVTFAPQVVLLALVEGFFAVELPVDARQAHVDFALLQIEVEELMAVQQRQWRVVSLGLRRSLGL